VIPSLAVRRDQRLRGPQARAIALPMPQVRAPLIAWLLTGLLSLAMLLAALPAHASAGPDSFADLAEKLLPAVVNISTSQTVKADRTPEMPQFPPGSPFEEFFKDFMERNGNKQDDKPHRATSLGSGFVIDPSGLVVTNNHVIADADEITVILQDSAAYKAEIVGRDTKTDLAVLRIKAPNKLVYVNWGNSDESRVGDWVLAIGNPFGLGGTVTAGILSARARDINAGPYDDFLQTDASINRGNSGGPMFNTKGEVIGINTAIISPSGGSIGIGFAIPSAMAHQVVNDLIKYGKTRRGWLGVHIQSLTEEIAESLGLKEAKGALVASVQKDGPAAKAGLKAGDIILRYDGREVPDSRRLPRMVAETAIGKTVPLDLWRDGRVASLSVNVGELQEADEAAEGEEETTPKLTKEKTDGILPLPSIGLSVAPLTAQTRQRFNLPDQSKGVVIADVAADGPAAEKNLKAGDLIEEVSLEPVASTSDFANKIEAARKSGRKSVLLMVESGDSPRIVAVRLDGAAKK